MRFRCRRVLLPLSALVLFLGLRPAAAQEGMASLSGRVTDPNGLAVTGARVQAVNVDTNTASSTETNDSGLYTLPSVKPGNYRIIVEKDGFKQIVRAGIDLHVADAVDLNFTLEIGSVSQSVTVEGEAPVVNTSNGSLGGLVDEEKIADLPLNGRNYIDLSLMQAGVTEDRAQQSDGGVAGKYFSSNGAGPWSNYYTLDGASMANGLGGSTGSAAGTTLGVDGIREYKVITNSFSAEYGMVMGSQLVMVSKGGTNTWSGDVFEYLRNSIFDARNYYDYGYLNGGPRLPHLVRNNYGGAFGGPIKKDKTFFYAVYEGLRQIQGISVVDTIPGQFCHPAVATAANNFGAGTVIWNGQGAQPAGSVGPCTQLGNNPSGANTNSVKLSSTMAPLLALYPGAPNLPNNQWTFPTSDPTIVHWGQIRIDHNFSPSDTFFVRYTIDNDTLNNSVTNSGTGNPAYPQFRLLSDGREQFLTLSENHIFSATLLNTARISFSRLTEGSINVYPQGQITGPLYSFVQGVPVGTIAVPGVSMFGPLGTKPANNSTQTFTISDDVFYSRGKHSLKFGTLLNRVYYYLLSDSGLYGSLTFGSFANFMLGSPTQYALLVPGFNTNRLYAVNTLGFYGQDDWRATSRLTLNLGLRYEFDTGLNELENRAYAFRGMQTLKPANPTQGPLTDNPSYKNLSPRVGFAYDVTGKGRTSIRGAFGVYYDIANFGSAVREADSGMPPLRLGLTVANPGPLGPFPLPIAGLAVGKSGQGIDYDAKQPYNMQYNLTAEQQLPFNIGLAVSYVGLRGVHLWEKMENNPELPTSIVNGVPYWTPTPTHPLNCGNAIVAPLTGFCRINPNLASFPMLQSKADSHYNSLQIVGTKRLSHGLEMQVAYTYSKSLDDTQNMSGDSSQFSGCGGPTDTVDNRVDYGPSCFDSPNNVRVNIIYHFPTMHRDGIVSQFANGWWMGNIISIQSGYPFTPVLTTNRSQDGVASTQADRVNVNTAASIAATFPSTCTSLPGQAPAGKTPCQYTPIPFNSSTVYTGSPQNWFNPLMFSLGPVGTLGNAGRDILRSPRTSDWDFSIVKDTAIPRISEKASLQFRAEMFNLLNHANFAAPSGSVFSGAVADTGPYSELPIGSSASNPFGTVGQILTTFTTSRQIQFALKLFF